MTNKTTTLIGYWNGSVDDPEITFNVKEDLEDKRRLVYITLDLIEEPSESETKTAFKKFEKGLRNLASSVKNLEKIR